MVSFETSTRRLRLTDLASEPFRILFPAGILAGLLGALLWPLHIVFGFGPYPGPQHAHLMVCGFFGGFILGFLGTAGPRLLGTPALQGWHVLGLGILHGALSLAFALGSISVGLSCFLVALTSFGWEMARRYLRRTTLPPPGFVMIPLAMACALFGGVLSLVNQHREVEGFWTQLQKLMLYQGFVLLPILGVGPFLFPRFFGATSLHEFPDTGRDIPQGWTREALIAGGVGIGVLGTFWLEASGWLRIGPGLRALIIAAYFMRTLPWRHSSATGQALGRLLRWGWIGILVGLGLRAAFPMVHVALMHWTFIAGFALVTLAVATRVIAGHCGARHLIEGRGRWLTVILVLVLVGMWTRVSGDLWPKIQKTHFTYGAILWIAALFTWAWYVLPGLFKTTDE